MRMPGYYPSNQEIELTIDRKGLIKNIILTTTFFVAPTDNGLDTLGAIGIMPEYIYTDINITIYFIND